MRQTQSSVFPLREPKPVGPDCLPDAPDFVHYYDGTSTLVPTLALEAIYFNGAISSTSPAGVGFDAGDSDAVSLRRDTIKAGTAGVKLRCPIAPSKQRMRFRIDPNANVEWDINFELTPLSSCQHPLEYEDENPLWVFYEPGRVETPCQKLYRLKEQWDLQYKHLGNAYVLQDETGQYVFDIETLLEGEFFQIKSFAGLTRASIIVPGKTPTYSPAIVKKWLDVTVANGVTLKAVEIFSTREIQGSLLTALTSNLSTATHKPEFITVTTVVLFADNAQGEIARQALLAALDRDADQIEDLIKSTACSDVSLYPYTVIRQDDGSTTATATVKTDYSAVSIARVGYTAGKSYYTITIGNTATPAASGTDVVKQGTAVAVQGGFTSPCA